MFKITVTGLLVKPLLLTVSDLLDDDNNEEIFLMVYWLMIIKNNIYQLLPVRAINV